MTNSTTILLKTGVLLLLLVLLFTNAATAQHASKPATSKQDTVLPQPGYNILKYFSENINNASASHYTSTKTIASFWINKNGTPEDIRIIKSISPSFDKEFIRVLRKMPRWQPGTVNGRPARLQYMLPLQLELE